MKHPIVLSEVELERNAEASFDERTKAFRASTQASIVKVSTQKHYSQRIETLRNLTSVTRTRLNAVEGELWAPWAAAQQISARQKVDLSISEGFKRYWRDLGSSVLFQGHTLIECVWRIHDDIIKVWNFNDPNKLLSKQDFLERMAQLVEPLLPEPETQNQSGLLSRSANVATVASAIFPHLSPVLCTVGVSTLALKSLYGKYRQMPSTGQYLSAYIVDLTCILHGLFLQTLTMDPPRDLSEELIFDTVTMHRQGDSKMIHRRVQGMTFGFEEKITGLIWESLGIR